MEIISYTHYALQIYLSEMAKNHLPLMVGENFEIYLSQMAKNAPKLSTMVGENFEIHLSEMAIQDREVPNYQKTMITNSRM